MQLNEQIIQVFSEVFDVDLNNLDTSFTPNDIENWDSIGHLKLIMALEEKLKIKFYTFEIPEMKSIQDFIDKINDKVRISDAHKEK